MLLRKRFLALVGSAARALFPRNRRLVERRWRGETGRIARAIRDRRYDRIEEILRNIEARLPGIEPDAAERVRKLNQLGDLFQETAGSNLDAERLYRQALATAESVLDPTHDALILSLNNLGLLLLDRRRFGEAAALFERALSLADRRFGAASPEAAACLENLAAAYRHTDRPAEADRLRRRALRIHRTARRGVRSPDESAGIPNAIGAP